MNAFRPYATSVLGVLLIVCAGSTTLRAQSNPAEATEKRSLNTLEGLVGEWTRLRLIHAEEEREWQRQRRQWQQEIALLGREERALTNEIAALQQQVADDATARNTLDIDMALYKDAEDALPPILASAENALREWPPRLPAMLRQPLQSAFDALPDDDTAREAQSTGQRLQRILGLYSKIEKLHGEVHVGRQILSLPEGRRRELDLCYLGLARGFAVVDDDSVAYIGTPSGNGWQWQPADIPPSQVRQAIRVARREQAATLVQLPLALSGDAQ